MVEELNNPTACCQNADGSNRQINSVNPTFCRFVGLLAAPIVNLQWDKALSGEVLSLQKCSRPERRFDWV